MYCTQVIEPFLAPRKATYTTKISPGHPCLESTPSRQKATRSHPGFAERTKTAKQVLDIQCLASWTPSNLIDAPSDHTAAEGSEFQPLIRRLQLNIGNSQLVLKDPLTMSDVKTGPHNDGDSDTSDQIR